METPETPEHAPEVSESSEACSQPSETVEETATPRRRRNRQTEGADEAETAEATEADVPLPSVAENLEISEVPQLLQRPDDLFEIIKPRDRMGHEPVIGLIQKAGFDFVTRREVGLVSAVLAKAGSDVSKVNLGNAARRREIKCPPGTPEAAEASPTPREWAANVTATIDNPVHRLQYAVSVFNRGEGGDPRELAYVPEAPAEFWKAFDEACPPVEAELRPLIEAIEIPESVHHRRNGRVRFVTQRLSRLLDDLDDGAKLESLDELEHIVDTFPGDVAVQAAKAMIALPVVQSVVAAAHARLSSRHEGVRAVFANYISRGMTAALASGCATVAANSGGTK